MRSRSLKTRLVGPVGPVLAVEAGGGARAQLDPHEAARKGFAAVVTVFDGHPERATVRDRDGQTPAHAAVRAREDEQITQQGRLHQRHEVVIDKEPGPLYDRIAVESMVFSADSRHFGYLGEVSTIVEKGPDGNEFVRPVDRPEYHIVLDGKPVLERDPVSRLTLASDGRVFVVADGQERPGLPGEDPGPPVASPDGKHFAYTLRKPTQYGPAIEIARGQVERRGLPGKYMVAIDGEPGPECNQVFPNGPTWRSDGSIEYLVRNEGALYRVKHVPSGE